MSTLQGLIYVSKAKSNFNLSDLRTLAEFSAFNNAKHNITGYLYFENGYFLQYLEGPPDKIADLMGIIAFDRRHKIVKQIALPDINERHFPDWSMQYLSESAVKKVKVEEILNDYIALLSADPEHSRSFPNGMRNIMSLLGTLSDFQMELQYL